MAAETKSQQQCTAVHFRRNIPMSRSCLLQITHKALEWSSGVWRMTGKSATSLLNHQENTSNCFLSFLVFLSVIAGCRSLQLASCLDCCVWVIFDLESANGACGVGISITTQSAQKMSKLVDIFSSCPSSGFQGIVKGDVICLTAVWPLLLVPSFFKMYLYTYILMAIT